MFRCNCSLRNCKRKADRLGGLSMAAWNRRQFRVVASWLSSAVHRRRVTRRCSGQPSGVACLPSVLLPSTTATLSRYGRRARCQAGRRFGVRSCGWLGRKPRGNPEDRSGYSSVLEEPGVFFRPRVRVPDGVARLGTLWWFGRSAWSAFKARIASELSRPTLVCRNVEVHRNGWRAVVRGDVVLRGVEREDTLALLRHHRRYILRRVRRHARRTAGGSWVARLPTGYAAVGVYAQDLRRRRMKRFGLGAELIGVLYLWRIRRVEHVDIVGATVETAGAWRLAWNRAWLERWGGPASGLK